MTKPCSPQPNPCATSTQRVRLHRQRRAEGSVKLTLRVNEDDLISALCTARLLDPCEADDHDAVNSAAEIFVRYVLAAK